MYVRPISTRLVRGRSTPAIRAILPRFLRCKEVRKWSTPHFLLSHFLTSSLPHFLTFSLSGKSPLPLLVLLVRTDHPHDAATANDLALVADLLDRCPDFHQRFLFFTSSRRHLHGASFTA